MSQELEKVYDIEGNCMYMTKEQAEKYRKQLIAILKECTPKVNGEKIGVLIIWGTAGEMDKFHDFKDLWYDAKHFDFVRNVWAESGKRSLSDLVVRADELKDDEAYEYYPTPDATHKNWIKGSECKLYKKYEEDMKNNEMKSWFGEQLNLFTDTPPEPVESASEKIQGAYKNAVLSFLAEQKKKSGTLLHLIRIDTLNLLVKYFSDKYPDALIEFKEGVPGESEDAFHITSGTQARSGEIVADLLGVFEPSLGVCHTFIHPKKEDNG